MKFVAALGTFIVALFLDTPFFVAVFLAVMAGVIVHFATKRDEESGATASEPDPAAETPAHDNREFVPNGSDPAALQAYLRTLTMRVRTLEKELRTLTGVSPREPEPAPRPVPEDMLRPGVPDETVRAPNAQAAPPADPISIAGTQVPFRPTPAAQSRSMVSDGVELNAPVPVIRKTIHAEPEPTRVATGDAGGASTPPTEPLQPAEPAFFSRLLSGNIVAKVGAIILFFGVGFLLKFAYERNMVSPEVRLIGVALTALVVFVLGWKLKDRRRVYGVILQGVASGLAYLDVFFALKTYGFINAPVGFALFALLGVITTMLAVRQDAKSLAVLGLTGAFMAPILASTGDGNVAILFTYYLLLNLFILAVSWFRSWRVLNLTGWLFTFAVAVIWGARSYRPELFSTVEPFLIAFFVIYLLIPILFAMRQPPELKGMVDGTLVFGTPAAVAVLQGRLVWDMPYGLAWSCALGAALYGLLSLMVFRHPNMKLLGETYIALAVGLGTLAIFYAFGAYTTFALWTIEGAAILWVCLRQKHLMGRLFAILVQAAGAAYFFLDYAWYPRFNPYFNDAVLGCAIIAAGSFISAALYRTYREEITEGERSLAVVILAWGSLCWSLGGLDVIHYAVATTSLKIAAAILFFSVSAVVAEIGGARIAWGALRGLTVIQPLVLLGAALLLFMHGTHPLAHLGWLAWPVGFGSLFWVLHRQESQGALFATTFRHMVALYTPIVLITWELVWWLVELQLGSAWRLAALAIPSSVAIFCVVAARNTGRWPLAPHWPLYRDVLLTPLAIGLLLFSVIANLRTPGTLTPLATYIPILNPIDLTIAIAALAVVNWGRSMERVESRHTVWSAMAVLGFLWVNAIALRTIHYWADIPYRFGDLMASVLVQATLSILWTATAFGLMLLGRRRMERTFWIAGAVLLAVVVGKLFLVDLANTGTVARIVSFLGVGVILLAIGYAAPVPPGVKEAEGRA